MTLVAVALTAAAGAVSRYLVDVAVAQRRKSTLPLGSLVVNVSGSLLLGFVVGLGLYHGVDETPRTVIGTGFVGAYTTFSTFSYETVRLLEGGARREALVNTALGVVLGLAAAVTGLAAAAAI